MPRIFDDRAEAGRALVDGLRGCALREPLIIGLPRGGVPVAWEVANALGAPLDVLVVRKLGAPFQPELAVGAIASGGIQVLNDHVLSAIPGFDENALSRIVARETAELERRDSAYRGGRSAPVLTGKDVVLVDDGMATGATMRAAAQAVRSQLPRSVTVAVPVASPDALDSVRALVDRVVCLEAPSYFSAVGQFYRHFGQTTDDEVRKLINDARRHDDAATR